MRFLVLGPVEVEEDAEAIALGGRRQRAVLALLVLDVGRSVTADRILTEIWGDRPPDGARDSLYTYVSNLRRALGKDRLVRADGGYRLNPADGDEIDTVVFERVAKRAGRMLGSDPETAGHLLDLGLGLWRGEPYEGFEDLASVIPETVRLEELRLNVSEDRIEAELCAGGTPTVGDVEGLCERHPYRERLWGLLARTLYRAGRQAEALRAFTRLRGLLGEELGIDLSPELARLEEQMLLQDPVLEPEAAPPPTNLPIPVSSFVGRVDELTLLDKEIYEHRLVTALGPGGVGKTRLAIEVARHTLGSFRDGVWLVDLAQVSQPELVPQAVAAALQSPERLGIDVTESIATHLQPRTTLLVLDNCEHVIETTAKLAAKLLERAPDLKILTTSRRALGLDGEVRFSLEGLATSTVEEPVLEAERLFEARASVVRSDFALDEVTRRSVVSICRHLDGMPLAIELAAARVDVLSPSEIDAHLARRFTLLTDSTSQRSLHRSLRASLDWSYELLTESEKEEFDTLGVFEGPFSATAATAVLDLESEIEIIDRLRSLLSASLIQVISWNEGSSLYRLLETQRLYARDHLIEAGRWDAAVERHDAHYRDVCVVLRPAFFGRGRVTAQQQIEAELADHHVAFDRLLTRGELKAGLEMGWPLAHLWLFSGRLAEGERRVTALLDASAGTGDRQRADSLTAASLLVSYRQEYERSIEWADEAIEIYRSTGDEQGLAYALARRGHFAFSTGDGPTAMASLQESLAICKRIGYPDGTAWPITLLAQARRWSGDESPEVRDMLEEGRERFIAMGEVYGQVHADMILGSLAEEGVEYQLRFDEEMVRLSEQPGADQLIRPIAFHNLAYGVWGAGEFDRARGLNRAAARAALEIGSTVNTGLVLLQAATFSGQRDDLEGAATLFGAGDVHFAMQKAPFMERTFQPVVDAVTEAVGANRYRELYEQGAAMSVEESTAFLLER